MKTWNVDTEDVKREDVNRVMLLTPPGPAAIAVVRLVGGKTTAFLLNHFSKAAAPGRAVHGTLSGDGHVIDDPLILLHDNGQGADISLHGGPWVVRQVLDLAQREGFELVQSNPPLPMDAVDGDDEIEREMLALIPLARTELTLRELAARSTELRRNQRNNRPAQDFLDDPSLRHLLYPPRVAIVGAPNAGKSTLANQLFAQERSITADAPGTTRDWVGEIADIDGVAVFLIDTPGLRDTDDAIEQTAIAASGPVVQSADLVVLVVDASRPINEQTEWAQRFPGALIVRNKCDLELPPPSLSAAHVHTVASIGGGIDALRQQIRRRFIRPWRYR